MKKVRFYSVTSIPSFREWGPTRKVLFNSRGREGNVKRSSRRHQKGGSEVRNNICIRCGTSVGIRMGFSLIWISNGCRLLPPRWRHHRSPHPEDHNASASYSGSPLHYQINLNVIKIYFHFQAHIFLCAWRKLFDSVIICCIPLVSV